MTDALLKRLFTDTDMHDQILKDEIEDFYDYLQRVIRNDQLTFPSNNYDLVLDIMVIDEEPEKQISWSYYYACHDARCLFWLETYDASYMTSELFGVKSPAHVSALHLSLQFPAVSTNLVCRASPGGPLLVGLPFPYGIGAVSADIVGIGITGHSIQLSLEIAVFHSMLMTSLWGF